MRKTSQDGGDSTSVTSGFENELKKTSVGIIKTKRTSIKRKVQNFSIESDDTVIEPLLQIDKNEATNRNAKYLLSKPNTESINECESDNTLSDGKIEKINVSKFTCPTGTTVTNSTMSRTLHNHMNTNVFGANGSTVFSTVKSPLLVEINGSRPVMHSNQSSSIFTTAKISADSITKNMEPIHVTPVPILSTVEVNVTKSGISSECQQSKTIALSSSSDVLKVADNRNNKDQSSKIQKYNICDSSQTINTMSDLSKPSTSGCLNKPSNKLERKSIATQKETESDSKLLTKSYDIKKANIITASVDSETTRKVIPQTKSLVNVTLDKKHPTIQERLNTEISNNNIQSQQQEYEVKAVIEIGENFPKQNISTVKTILSQEVNVTKEGKNNTGSIKQLQRQKNSVLEDPSESDICSTKTKFDEVKNQTSSSVVPINKPNVKTPQSLVSSNLDTFIEKSSGNICKSLVTNSKVSAGTNPQSALKSNIPVQQTQSTSLFKKDLSVKKSLSVCSGEATNTDIATTTTTAEASQHKTSAKLTTGNQINKSKTENSSQFRGSDSRSSASITEIQSIASLKSELVKDNKKSQETPSQTSKSGKDISIQEFVTKLPISATDTSSISVNSSSTTIETVSLKNLPVSTIKQTTSVSSKSCIIKDVKLESSTNKPKGISTVLPTDPISMAKTDTKSKPLTTKPISTEIAADVSKVEPSSSISKSAPNAKVTSNASNSTSTATVATSSFTAAKK